MRLWRLVKQRYAPGLDGEGARIEGGRWNSPGVPVVYCASSVALAALELYVHLPPELRTESLLPPLRLIGLEVDDSLVGALDLASAPEADQARRIGDDWLVAAAGLALSVPARTVPFDCNVLLNPRHTAMPGVKVVIDEPFRFDDRLL